MEDDISEVSRKRVRTDDEDGLNSSEELNEDMGGVAVSAACIAETHFLRRYSI